jgi:uncharacterized membrane protein YbhN (UPF0104 family)
MHITERATKTPSIAESQNTSRRVAWIIITVVITLGLFAWIVSKIDFQEFVKTMQATNWWWAAGAYAATVLYHLWRALRTRLMLSQPIPLLLLYATMCLNAVIRNVAPWLGEPGFIWLLKKLHRVDLSRATAIWATQRLFDVAIILGVAFLVFVSASFEHLDQKLRTAIDAALGVGLGAVILGVGGLLVARWLSPDELDHLRGVANQNFVGHFLARIRQGSRNIFWHVREVSRLHLMPMLSFYSVAMWASLYLAFVCYLNALDSGLSLTQILWLFVLVLPISFLPVQGIASIGTHEAAWFLALNFLGVEPGRAAILAVGSHALMLISVVVLLALGLALRLICRKVKIDPALQQT